MITNKYNYEIIQNIIEFYKLQPGVKNNHLDKLEEYLVVLSSFISDAFNDLNEIRNSEVIDNYEDIIDVLNSYINSVSEEIKKIFLDDNISITPLLYDDQFNLNEIQIIEYYKKINNGDQNEMNLSEYINSLENSLYDKAFGEILCDLTLSTIKEINSDLIIRVEDLM